ncbi:MAG: sensor histidine kinase [Haloferacaceae archaeon]
MTDRSTPEEYRAEQRALRSMHRIIGDLLHLARENEQVGERAATDVRDVADRAWRTACRDEDDAELVPDDALGDVVADEDRLRQLFENLFRNAIDHGGSDVRVRVVATADGFAVADDGSGVPEADRDRVFDRGYSTSDGGTGFGLYIVREIADGHGWAVRLTESDDGGARFEIRAA